MTRQEFLDRCPQVEREYGEMFPLWALTGEAGVKTLVDPLTNTCFAFLDDGLVTIPTSQGFDITSGTPFLQRPQDYMGDRPEEVQQNLERALEAAVAHLLRVAKLAGRRQAADGSQRSV